MHCDLVRLVLVSWLVSSWITSGLVAQSVSDKKAEMRAAGQTLDQAWPDSLSRSIDSTSIEAGRLRALRDTIA